ncbi:MAG: ATP-binding protein [Elusimicrobiota bacterium]
MPARKIDAAFVVVSAILAIPFAAAVIAHGWPGAARTQGLVELLWVAPVAQGIMILAGVSLTILLMGRYRALGGAWAYWSGMAFAVNSVFGVFYLLSWPGLLGEGGVVGRLPNTTIWFAYLTILPIALMFAAVRARHPESLTRGAAIAGYAGAVVASSLIGLGVVAFEDALPNLFINEAFSSRALVAAISLSAAAAAGGVQAWRRSRLEKSGVLGYLGLFLVVFAYGLFYSILGRRRYDAWWYSGRVEVVLSYVILLFGFLQEGYRLFSGERARAEERARLLEQLDARTSELEFHDALLRAQQETALDGMLVADDRGRIISHNRRFGELWGIPPDTWGIGNDRRIVRAVLSKVVDPKGFFARIKHLYPRREEHSGDEIYLRDGRTFELFSSPVFGGRKHYYGRIWYFRDITARMRAEKDLRDKTYELSRSNAELAVYAHTVSHDLIAPLSKISMYGELLIERVSPKLEEKERDYLDRIHKTAIGMAKMLRDILAISRVGRTPELVETADWKRVIDGILSDLEVPIARAGAAILLGELPRIRVHEILIRQLLQNLVANAVKFRRKDRAARIEIGGRLANGGVELYVRDNGIGFPQKCAEEIFKPFVRLNCGGDYEGSGIGLSTCRRIAQRLGGRLRGEGVPGEGATFTLWLPKEFLETPRASGS